MGVFIIAEIGVNHNGDVDLAKKLIDAAVEAGADAVKFQTFITEEVIVPNTSLAEYQKRSYGEVLDQFNMLKKFELSFTDFIELKDYCDKKGITFVSTPFDIKSAKFLRELGVEIFKIASGEITNFPLLREIGSYGKRIIMSTGMADLGEIEDAINVLVEYGTARENITLLHCISEYPAPYEEVNLRAIITLKESFKLRVGFSDHTLDIEIPIAAVALGAEVIEKHLTLSKNMVGPDHKASLEPLEFKKMVESIRNVEKAMGSGIKKPSPSEKKNINIVRKFIVAKRTIEKGEIFTEENITVKRCGGGLSPMMWSQVLGKKAPKKFQKDEPIYISCE